MFFITFSGPALNTVVVTSVDRNAGKDIIKEKDYIALYVTERYTLQHIVK